MEGSLLNIWVALVTCQSVVPTLARPGAPGGMRGKEAEGLGAGGMGQPNELGKSLRTSPWGLFAFGGALGGGPLDVPRSCAYHGKLPPPPTEFWGQRPGWGLS